MMANFDRENSLDLILTLSSSLYSVPPSLIVRRNYVTFAALTAENY